MKHFFACLLSLGCLPLAALAQRPTPRPRPTRPGKWPAWSCCSTPPTTTCRCRPYPPIRR
ncbi:MAG: hypothetical protein WKG07_39645 [Hymenobacter sp.]